MFCFGCHTFVVLKTALELYHLVKWSLINYKLLLALIWWFEIVMGADLLKSHHWLVQGVSRELLLTVSLKVTFLILLEDGFSSVVQLIREGILKTWFEGYRKRWLLFVLKSPLSLNEGVLWLKSLPWSVTWAFPFCSPIISWDCGAQPNPSSSKPCGQQSAGCDHQLITLHPSDQAQSPHRCEASLVLNTLAGGSAAEERLPQTALLKGFCGQWSHHQYESEGSMWGSTIRLTFQLSLNYFLSKSCFITFTSFLIERNAHTFLFHCHLVFPQSKDHEWAHYLV